MNTGASDVSFPGVGKRPWLPLTIVCIQADDVHVIAKTQELLREPTGNPQLRQRQLRIEKQLHRVVARLTMNVHSTREVRRAFVVEPIVVGEPSVALCHRDQFTGRA